MANINVEKGKRYIDCYKHILYIDENYIPVNRKIINAKDITDNINNYKV